MWSKNKLNRDAETLGILKPAASPVAPGGRVAPGWLVVVEFPGVNSSLHSLSRASSSPTEFVTDIGTQEKVSETEVDVTVVVTVDRALMVYVDVDVAVNRHVAALGSRACGIGAGFAAERAALAGSDVDDELLGAGNRVKAQSSPNSSVSLAAFVTVIGRQENSGSLSSLGSTIFVIVVTCVPI